MGVAPLGKNYFDALLAQHLRTILESGLLVDEDYNVLLNVCSFKIYPVNSNRNLLGLIVGGLGVIGPVCLAWKYNKPILTLPSFVATVLLYREAKRAAKRKRYEAIVSTTTKSFVKVRKLNTTVIRYMKARKATKETENLLVFSENVREFVRGFIKENVLFLKFLLNALESLTSTIDELTEDFKTVKEIDFEALLVLDEANEDFMAKLQDIYIFLTSKYLNYLGLTFNYYMKQFNESFLEQLFDQQLPSVQFNLEILRSTTQREFNNVRYNVSKKLEINISQSKVFSTKQLSGKFQHSLINAVNNLSVIMEKSRVVLCKIDEIDENCVDFRKMELALNDLREHAQATYESLDVLCRLYGILSDTEKYKSTDKSMQTSKTIATKEDELPTINYDDQEETNEDKDYELYIPESEIDDIQPSYQKDESGVYLNLMLSELKHSLGQHERFLAAKTKWRIQQDDEHPPVKKKSNKPIAKFDLSTIKTTPLENQKIDPLNIPPLPLPPPPPPLPPPQQNFLEESYQTNEVNVNLFDGIQTLSRQLKGEEEVFCDDCDSD
ncbi:hypothetical protein ABEB36_010315 [Hypothenemus hampei]|uniref:Vezatin n=1 Tax=Hypothenemus hampei TaxID=57062 RepID=A0ABD1EM74_HYPHA